jgi:uncharacterized protein
MAVAFHLALPVSDLAAARAFYGDVLGCCEGRSAPTWVDFNLFGHQLSLHLLPEASPRGATNPVDGDAVPIPHFGCVLTLSEWHHLRERLEAAGTEFIVGPRTRFEGEVGEQATLFIRDPAGHALEFKAFADPSTLFANDP